MVPRRSCVTCTTRPERPHLATTPCHLGGLSVLVTRPAHQADGLCELIASAHGRPVRFPTLEIRGPADKQAARTVLAGIRDGDLLVFVSANAVQYAFPLLPDRLPLDLAIAAVGTATAKALDDHGLDPTIVPARMDSEGLMQMPALQDAQLGGRRVFLLCGNDGRELLQETLAARGADLHRVEVYRRQLPDRRAAVGNLVNGWDRLVDVVTATSNAILDNLFTLLGDDGADRVRNTPLVVVSARMAAHAAELGCSRVLVADSARDADMLAALCRLEAEPGTRR
ncbi:MAG: uroporphyrinogen-III synthase [Gammaproteobacteria bacterium]|nr:uroporphyrinogen-III synthase [Gammaproteobacteria bacterium]